MTVEFPHVSEGDVFNAQNNIKPDVLIENNRAGFGPDEKFAYNVFY